MPKRTSRTLKQLATEIRALNVDDFQKLWELVLVDDTTSEPSPAAEFLASLIADGQEALYSLGDAIQQYVATTQEIADQLSKVRKLQRKGSDAQKAIGNQRNQFIHRRIDEIRRSGNEWNAYRWQEVYDELQHEHRHLVPGRNGKNKTTKNALMTLEAVKESYARWRKTQK
jgi:hypothetical protein